MNITQIKAAIGEKIPHDFNCKSRKAVVIENEAGHQVDSFPYECNCRHSEVTEELHEFVLKLMRGARGQ